VSGGSYDYLFVQDFEPFFIPRENMERMRDRLRELGYEDAAKQTEEVMEVFFVESGDPVEARWPALRQAWKHVEWLDSNDIGKDQLQERMAEDGFQPERKRLGG
jgi:hypothetical protein